MSRQRLNALQKRLQAVEERKRPVRYGWTIINHGEDAELAAAKWRRENGAADRVIVRCIVTGVPRAGDEPGPRAELCRRESLLQAIPAAKEQLNGWAKSGASEHLKAVAKHWQNLCEQFSIEDTP